MIRTLAAVFTLTLTTSATAGPTSTPAASSTPSTSEDPAGAALDRAHAATEKGEGRPTRDRSIILAQITPGEVQTAFKTLAHK